MRAAQTARNDRMQTAINMKQWIADQINAPQKKAMPILSFPSISLLGITVSELINDDENQVRGMQQIAARVDSAASLGMMDLSVESEAFGSTIQFSDDEVPTVTGALITTEQEAEKLIVPAVGAGRTGKYIKAIGKAATRITDRPVLAGILGPFSLAGRLMDVNEALVNCLAEPDMMHAALRKATAFLVEYAKAYKAVGAHGMVIAEPLAGLLSPALAAEFSGPYVRKIVDAVQDDNFAVVYHNCGNGTIAMIDSILDTRCSAFHFGNAINMEEMMPHIPTDIIAMGNVSPAGEFRGGSPESIYAETHRIMSACCKYPNFVISSGCDIPPLSSWANIDSFFKAVKDFYANA